jgi:hypothetical protein
MIIASLPSFRFCLVCLAVTTLLGACEVAPSPDHTIKLMPSADGKRTIAVPPECLSWHNYANGPLENQPWPQYGCAQARNLAAQVERPEDLVAGKPLGSGDAVLSSASIQNYRAGKTKALIDAKSDAPIAQTPTGAGATP